MNDKTLLAAVRAAANDPASIPAADLTSQHQEIPMAETQNGPAAPAKITSLAELQSAYPDLCAALTKEATTAGATAERERIIGIDALDARGHDEIVAKAKADGKSGAADVALAINLAEKNGRALQLAAVQNVEAAAAAVKPNASASGHDMPQVANTPDGWKAEYAKSPDLQSEFASADVYVSFKQGESEGRVRRLSHKSA